MNHGVSIPGDLEIGGTLTVSTILDYQPIPSGIIVMWSGSTIPNGWTLCDGTQGTPDLRNKFIKGGDTSQIGVEGGANTKSITIDDLPPHTHTITDPGHTHTGTTSTNGSHSHTIYVNDSVGDTEDSMRIRMEPDGRFNSTSTTSAGNHSHTLNIDASTTGITVGSTGGGNAWNNEPAYYVLAYIMKLPYP